MPGRELSETEEAVKLVMKKGLSVRKAALLYGLSINTIYMAIKRRDAKWFQKHPMRRVV